MNIELEKEDFENIIFLYKFFAKNFKSFDIKLKENILTELRQTTMNKIFGIYNQNYIIIKRKRRAKK